MHVFLGITGASGAPYAARLLEALASADCEIGVCASSAGIEVLGTELFGEPTLPGDEPLPRARLLPRRRNGREPRGLRGRARSRSTRARSRPHAALGSDDVTVE